MELVLDATAVSVAPREDEGLLELLGDGNERAAVPRPARTRACS